MQEKIEGILKMYEGMGERHCAVLRDVLHDLIFSYKQRRGIQHNFKIDESNQELFKPFIEETTKDVIEMQKTLQENKVSFRNNDYSGYVVKNKKRLVFSQTESGRQVLEVYNDILHSEELDDINRTRNAFLHRLCYEKILHKMDNPEFDISDEEADEVNDMLEKEFEGILDFGNNGKLQGINIAKLPDEMKEGVQVLSDVFGENELQRAVDDFFDFELLYYNFKIEQIEGLYNSFMKTSGKKQKSSYIEYQGDKLVLFYNDIPLEFEGGGMPYKILSHLYHSDFSGKITLPELFKKIYGRDYREYLYPDERKSITDGKDGINARFKKKHKNNKKIIQFKDDVFTKLR